MRVQIDTTFLLALHMATSATEQCDQSTGHVSESKLLIERDGLVQGTQRDPRLSMADAKPLLKHIRFVGKLGMTTPNSWLLWWKSEFLNQWILILPFYY